METTQVTERLIGELRGLGETLWRLLKKSHKWIGRHRLLVIIVSLNLFMLSWTAVFSYQTRPYSVYAPVEDGTIIITDSYGYICELSNINSPLSLYPPFDITWAAFNLTAEHPLDADVYARGNDSLLDQFINVTRIPMLNYTEEVNLILRTNETESFMVAIWFCWCRRITQYQYHLVFPLERVIYHLLTYGIVLIMVTDILLLMTMTAIAKEGVRHED